jgi:hypothetical protein
MKKKILTTLILIMICTLASCQCVKAATEIKTTLQIKGDPNWTNISISDAYDKCQELKGKNSALGENVGENVMPHLLTNADYFAVSVLAISHYGNGAGNTTGNDSGVIGWGKAWVFTAGIYEGYEDTTNINLQSIVKNKESKFVEKLKYNQEENLPGRGLLVDEKITGGRNEYYSTGFYHSPCMVREGLFSLVMGNSNMGCSGGPHGHTTFRPAIWVK